jgi:putative oxygen-independent coproporphyrinogen III oxidase
MARALYIHWPFCARKCPYCDFNSHVRASVDHQAWQAALLADLAHEARVSDGGELDSIFFGGGTPSLMPPATVAALLDAAARRWRFAPDIEITLEANPSSVEAARFADLAQAGVNRVSLGLQALDDEALRFLGRLHDAAEGLAALEVAQAAFARVSFDLIYARPGQTAAAWERELARALGLGTEHLSLYQLTIEPGTRFATLAREGRLEPLGNDPAADLFALTRAIATAARRPPYEVSNHAAPGAESRHNLAYWRYRGYCGIGPGAHGRRNGSATVRHKKPETYLAAVVHHGNGIAEETPLSRADQAIEALMMGLRLNAGIDLAALGERFGFAPAALIDPAKLRLHSALGHVVREGPRLMVTETGFPLLDALLGDLVSGELVAA